MKNNYFWCPWWNQRIQKILCIRRYKKGLKKCEGCETGQSNVKELLEERKDEKARPGI